MKDKARLVFEERQRNLRGGNIFQVEEVARRLAMVPEEGAALPIYFLSYLQSFLMIKNASPIPQSEIEDNPIDVESLNTYDILHRAR